MIPKSHETNKEDLLVLGVHDNDNSSDFLRVSKLENHTFTPIGQPFKLESTPQVISYSNF